MTDKDYGLYASVSTIRILIWNANCEPCLVLHPSSQPALKGVFVKYWSIDGVIHEDDVPAPIAPSSLFPRTGIPS